MTHEIPTSSTPQQQGEIILYQPDETVRLEVRLEDDTVWLNRQQLAELFGRDVKTIGKHVNNALKEELKDISVIAKFATTARDGKTYQVDYYNLDMVLSVGYRVKSSKGVQFRTWANKVIRNYLLRGYSINYQMRQLEQKLDSQQAEHRQGNHPQPTLTATRSTSGRLLPEGRKNFVRTKRMTRYDKEKRNNC
jgi:hypothetical protein